MPEMLRIAVNSAHVAARSAARQRSTCAWLYLARPAFSDPCIVFSLSRKFCVVLVSHSASLVPAASLRINCAAVQQLYAIGQIVVAKSVAVFSMGMPLTAPQPSRATVSADPVKNVLLVMLPLRCKSHPRGQGWRNCWGPARVRRQRLGEVFSL